MSVTQKWITCCYMWCVYEVGIKFHFPNNTCMSLIVHICILVITTSFVWTSTLLLLTTCLIIVNANISWNTTVTTIVIYGQFSTGPMDLFHIIAILSCFITDKWLDLTDLTSYVLLQVKLASLFSNLCKTMVCIGKLLMMVPTTWPSIGTPVVVLLLMGDTIPWITGTLNQDEHHQNSIHNQTIYKP